MKNHDELNPGTDKLIQADENQAAESSENKVSVPETSEENLQELNPSQGDGKGIASELTQEAATEGQPKAESPQQVDEAPQRPSVGEAEEAPEQTAEVEAKDESSLQDQQEPSEEAAELTPQQQPAESQLKNALQDQADPESQVSDDSPKTLTDVNIPGELHEADDQDQDHDQDHDHDHEDHESAEELSARYASLSKQELVDSAEELVQHEDVNHIRKHIGFIKIAFRKLVKEENLAHYEKNLTAGEQEENQEAPLDPLSERFETAFNIYREKKAAFDNTQEKQKQENLAQKEAILEELRQLIESEEELKRTYDQFHALQEKWRQIGQVPQNAKSTLWNNYHFLVEKFFDKVKINKELKDLDLKRNLEAKTELCEKAEELLLEPSISKSFQRLQKLHEAWKEIGPVPNDKKEEIWDRFKAATEKLNKRRQEHYDQMREEQNQNYAAKLVLCEQAEQLAAHTPDTPRKWQDLTNQINKLFSAWKNIGFAPKKVNNEVWNRFRSSLDTFFKNKKEFFSKYKDQQTENYNQKLNLCVQAEILKDSEDWRQTTDQLIALQKEWKKIGPVPSKYSDKIWKRFRAACDAFFEKKAGHFSSLGEKQDENLKQKQELIEKVRNYPYTDNNNENLEVLKGFQREWMEIGHVPIKQKDKIQGEFRKAIDEQFEKLRLNKKVKTTLSFHSKIENLKNSPNAENIIYKERNMLMNKITSLQNDIMLWENNIGFFASSKKADVLKAEFEEKIENARQEIAVMKEKLKILRDA